MVDVGLQKWYTGTTIMSKVKEDCMQIRMLVVMSVVMLTVVDVTHGVWRGRSSDTAEWPEVRKGGGVSERVYAQDEIVLARRVINTREAAERFARSKRVQDKIEAPVVRTLTARGTAPYVVQFNVPVSDEVRNKVQARGAEVYGYMPYNALVIGCAPGRLEELARLREVRWIGAYESGDKLQAAVGAFAERGGDEVRRVRIVTFRAEDAVGIGEVLAALGGGVEEVTAGEDRGYVRAAVTPKMIKELSGRAELEWIEPYIAPKLLNNVAVQAPRMNVWNVWTNYGLTGKGQIVAVSDTGLDTGNLATMHPDFTNRIRAAYALGRVGDWSDTDGHGTHVSGSVLGNGSASGGQFRGVAYEAELMMQSVLDSGGNLGGLPSDLNHLYRQVYTNGARIHSDSWGASVNGQYTTDSRATDQFMWNNKDMLIVFAAGNEGIDANSDGVIDFDSLSSPGTAKNIVTVGAAENQRTSGGYSTMRWGTGWPVDYPANPIKDDYISRPWDNVNQGMAAFSSRGPCDDGRVKPDVCAPGTDVISCRSRAPGADTGWGVYNTMYVYMGGTSMATPLTAGAAALVRQYLVERRGITNPSAALVKAVLINGAKSLTPGQYGTGAAREIPGWPRPNNVEGWGQVNVEASLFPPAGCTNIVIDAAGIQTGTTNTYAVVVPGGRKLSITLAWTDYPASLSAGKMLVNDLDLVVETPWGEVQYGNTETEADRLNNVEGIDFLLAEGGEYTVNVIGHNVPQGPQPYALVMREDTAIATPLLRYGPTNVVVYESGSETIVVSNAGNLPLTFQLSKPLPGYDMSDSDAPGGPVFAWEDITTNGTSVLLNDDSVQGPFGLPFAFPFFGSTYTTFTIGANGGIGLASGAISPNNTALPTSSAPNPFLAVFWDDLDPGMGGTVYYHATTGRVVVAWVDVPRYGTTQNQTFQAILYPSGEIVYQYKTMNGTLNSCTIGIQASALGPAVQKAFNQTYVKNNLALRFRPGSGYDWLTVSPTNGTVSAGGYAIVTVSCDASGKTNGVYEGTLRLTHNAPVKAKEVRVTMIVPEGSGVGVIVAGLMWVLRRSGRCRCE